jgi:hypothetical protein
MAQEKIDNYFLSLPEPHQSCLLFLRSFLLGYSEQITEKRSFNTPFYHYKGKALCFISYDPKSRIIYISFTRGFLIDHPNLVSEGRKQHKVFYADPEKDIDVESLTEILDRARSLY